MSRTAARPGRSQTGCSCRLLARRAWPTMMTSAAANAGQRDSAPSRAPSHRVPLRDGWEGDCDGRLSFSLIGPPSIGGAGSDVILALGRYPLERRGGLGVARRVAYRANVF